MVSSMSWNLDLETFEAGDFLGWPQADNSEAHCLEDCVIHVSLLRCRGSWRELGTWDRVMKRNKLNPLKREYQSSLNSFGGCFEAFTN